MLELYPEYSNVGFKQNLLTKTAIVPYDTISVNGKEEFYRSIYRFNSDILRYKSLANIKKGLTFYADYLVFDIDAEELSVAYKDMHTLIGYLGQRDVGYETWFSGSKGFHVNIPTSQFKFAPTDSEDVLKEIAIAIATHCHITIDTKIYNTTRILRMPYSYNNKGDLYKIPINPNNSLESILEQAKTTENEDVHPEVTDYPSNTFLISLYRALLDSPKINRTLMPTDEPANTRLFVRAKEGDRNDTLYKLARKLARRSIGEADALLMCGFWSTTLEKPMSELEVKKTVMSAYVKGVNELVDESNYQNHFFDAKRSLSGVRRLVSNLNNTVIRTGYKFIDNYTMGLYRGDVVFIIARPGNYKTCIASSILQNISETTGKKTLLFSMEMGPDRLNMRHMQHAEELSQIEVIQKVKAGHTFDTYQEKFKDVEVIGLSSLTIEMVIGMIDWYLEEKGEIGAIAFDYLSLFRGCANNTEKTAQVVTELKTRVAKAANCVTFCLVQGKRVYEGSRGNIEIDLQAGKDSSSIEDSGDYVIGAWEHEGKKYGRFLKSRAFNSEEYNEGPYFEWKLNRPCMKLIEVEHVMSQDKPDFAQKPKGGGYD